jgi:hypothetical protein
VAKSDKVPTGQSASDADLLYRLFGLGLAHEEATAVPLSGKGMLITIMDADPAEEADFNRWYDREHIIERTAIAGFLEARRYVAVDASPRYVNFYTTEAIEVFDSPAYRAKLDNPTPWTSHHSPRFRNSTRVVARVTGSKGQGRGGALALSRIRPPAGGQGGLRNAILAQFDTVVGLDRVISVHLFEADAKLSNPQRGGDVKPGSGDWYVAVEGTDAEAVGPAADQRFGRGARLASGELIAFGTYRLLWDLTKAELDRWPR